jgi:DNA-directed RNA polymerase specialized sigma24 family protein
MIDGTLVMRVATSVAKRRWSRGLDLDDLVGEAALGAVEAAAKGATDPALLRTAARCRVVDHVRRERGDRRRSGFRGYEPIGGLQEGLTGRFASPEDMVAAAEGLALARAHGVDPVALFDDAYVGVETDQAKARGRLRRAVIQGGAR